MKVAARLALVASLSLIAAGCAHRARAVNAGLQAAGATPAMGRQHAARPAAALVFDPPLLQDTPPLELSRDLREPSAFMGFSESVAEYFYVRWDDRQVGGEGAGFGFRGGSFGTGDRYERRAISEKTGVLYR